MRVGSWDGLLRDYADRVEGKDSFGVPESRGRRRRCLRTRLGVPRLVPIKEDRQDHNIKDHAADHRQYDRAYLAERTTW